MLKVKVVIFLGIVKMLGILSRVWGSGSPLLYVENWGERWKKSRERLGECIIDLNLETPRSLEFRGP